MSFYKLLDMVLPWWYMVAIATAWHHTARLIRRAWGEMPHRFNRLAQLCMRHTRYQIRVAQFRLARFDRHFYFYCFFISEHLGRYRVWLLLFSFFFTLIQRLSCNSHIYISHDPFSHEPFCFLLCTKISENFPVVANVATQMSETWVPSNTFDEAASIEYIESVWYEHRRTYLRRRLFVSSCEKIIW